VLCLHCRKLANAFKSSDNSQHVATIRKHSAGTETPHEPMSGASSPVVSCLDATQAQHHPPSMTHVLVRQHPHLPCTCTMHVFYCVGICWCLHDKKQSSWCPRTRNLGPAELHYTIMPCCAEKLLVKSASGPQASFKCFQAGCLCFYSVWVSTTDAMRSQAVIRQ
jgi:hypothetical protein